jgi:hypothetical protein
VKQHIAVWKRSFISYKCLLQTLGKPQILMYAKSEERQTKQEKLASDNISAFTNMVDINAILYQYSL